METEPSTVAQKEEKPIAADAKSPAVETPATATPVEDNTEEKMDIEPATPTSDNDTHPSSNNQTNTPSDIVSEASSS